MDIEMNVPKLRFAGFTGEWSNRKYAEVFTFRSTNSYSRDFLNYESGNVKNIHYGDIHTKFSTLFDVTKENVPFVNQDVNIKKIPLENYCKEGDLIIADASEDYDDVGKCIEIVNLNGEKVLAGLHTILARPELLNMAIGFSAYLMQNNSFRLQLKTVAQGTKVLSISAKQLSLLNLNIPSLPEQQKIASFLTSVDKKLTQLKKKKALLDQYKKGMMQKIFSQEIRFKDDNGEEFADWKERLLGELFTLTLRPINKPSHNYTALGIRSHFKGTFQRFDSDPAKIDMDTLYVVHENDLIVNITFAWEGAVAIARAADHRSLVSHRFPTYINEKSIIDINFFRYLYPTERFKSTLELISPGGAGRNRVLKKGDFIKISVNIPPMAEQNKIGNFLSAIDKKINYTKTQIEKTEQWKKGLLQQMFV